ncbi:hypothetical protein NAPIS_ORF02285 [Vairimorpha apis BRL 01]|uniref:Uncharacterized protein n=1 Tax=Vairimorpha apis BRL 01 TaxID=1037528 RepID=T0MGH0_9MICR|nr:hypothetical protein NAPIS_ORF02285 [Vairimorpha apis BRL 01]
MTFLPIFSSMLITIGISALFKKKKEKLKFNKPVVIIDPFETLLKYKFSLLNLRYIFYRRKYTEEFLFNMGYLYDLVFITDNSLINNKLYTFLDPLGVVKYKFYTSNKKKEIKNILDYNEGIVLSNKDNEKTLNIGNYSNGNLLDVVDFFSSIKLMNVNMIKTIESYKNKDFFKSWNFVQNRIFDMRNMLSFKKYRDIKKQSYIDKINTYKENKQNILNES